MPAKERKSRAEISWLQQEIASLGKQQAEAQKIAAVVGMTVDDSLKYRQRHAQIRELTRQLSELGARTAQEQEAEKIAAHCAESDQTSGPIRGPFWQQPK
jgi:hypothetical protein